MNNRRYKNLRRKLDKHYRDSDPAVLGAGKKVYHANGTVFYTKEDAEHYLEKMNLFDVYVRSTSVPEWLYKFIVNAVNDKEFSK